MGVYAYAKLHSTISVTMFQLITDHLCQRALWWNGQKESRRDGEYEKGEKNNEGARDIAD